MKTNQEIKGNQNIILVVGASGSGKGTAIKLMKGSTYLNAQTVVTFVVGNRPVRESESNRIWLSAKIYEDILAYDKANPANPIIAKETQVQGEGYTDKGFRYITALNFDRQNEFHAKLWDKIHQVSENQNNPGFQDFCLRHPSYLRNLDFLSINTALKSGAKAIVEVTATSYQSFREIFEKIEGIKITTFAMVGLSPETAYHRQVNRGDLIGQEGQELTNAQNLLRLKTSKIKEEGKLILELVKKYPEIHKLAAIGRADKSVEAKESFLKHREDYILATINGKADTRSQDLEWNITQLSAEASAVAAEASEKLKLFHPVYIDLDYPLDQKIDELEQNLNWLGLLVFQSRVLYQEEVESYRNTEIKFKIR
ncbi:MAG: hypothetical protein H7230_04120 [Candidatus Parcubacteria bacterium]|nr:hypothetical protein [Candidatus Paceibacterota bacterium]